MKRTEPTDGFRLAYEREGSGPPVLLLHGWPGSRSDFADVRPLLRDHAELIVPDLRGFGDSDRHPAEDVLYGPRGQAAAVLALLDELGIEEVVLGGYDVGSLVGQRLARVAPQRLRAMVVTPPVPGGGPRALAPDQVTEYWYQSFHRQPLAGQLVDGDPERARAYVAHFWHHWSAPGWAPDDERLDTLGALYGRPGAFTASVGWYRAGPIAVERAQRDDAPPPDDRTGVPATVVWPEHDPLFPLDWSDRLDDFFADVELRRAGGSGHFVPVEAPAEFAAAIRDRLG